MLTYLDSSVALAYLFAEPRSPPVNLWNDRLVSSRLLEYEVWNRIHARRFGLASNASARALLSGVELLEMNHETLARALEPFPVPVRTSDALHLATVEFIRGAGEEVELASYDKRLLSAAEALGIPAATL